MPAVPWIDISMPLAAGMPSFPGDPVFANEPVRSLAKGDPYSVSALRLGSHAGTHVDPPCHFLAGGATIDEVDLGRLNGPCVVVDIPPNATSIGPAELGSLPPNPERVLFRTRNSARWRAALEFFPDYVAVSDAGAAELLRRGVRLVGVDSLSVERDADGRFPVHHRLLGGGSLILEGLLLDGASPGRYSLHCMPLRVRRGDGGPARAALTAL